MSVLPLANTHAADDDCRSRCHSQVRNPNQLELCDDVTPHWEVLSEAVDLGRYKPAIRVYEVPSWARTWKMMIFVFRQQKKWWDIDWAEHQHTPRDTLTELERLEEEVSGDRELNM